MAAHEANQQPARELNLVLRDAEGPLRDTAAEESEKVEDVRSSLAVALVSAKAACEQPQNTTVQAAETMDHVRTQSAW